MEKIINYENLRSFAYVSDKICEKPIKGIVVDLFGLGDMTMFWEDPDIAEECAKAGILYVIPYNNPWAWMNPQSIAFTDEIMDVIFEKYGLEENTPVVAVGGSMGGLASLVYTKYAKRTPVACLANCPVCDLHHRIKHLRIGIDQGKCSILKYRTGYCVINNRFAEEITAGAAHDDFGSFGIGAHLKILSILMLFSIFNDYFQGVFSAGDTGFSAIAPDVHFLQFSSPFYLC